MSLNNQSNLNNESDFCKEVGQYANVPSPLCVGAKMLWHGKSYHISRN